jgi:hypothetical protein
MFTRHYYAPRVRKQLLGGGAQRRVVSTDARGALRALGARAPTRPPCTRTPRRACFPPDLSACHLVCVPACVVVVCGAPAPTASPRAREARKEAPRAAAPYEAHNAPRPAAMHPAKQAHRRLPTRVNRKVVRGARAGVGARDARGPLGDATRAHFAPPAHAPHARAAPSGARGGASAYTCVVCARCGGAVLAAGATGTRDAGRRGAASTSHASPPRSARPAHGAPHLTRGSMGEMAWRSGWGGWHGRGVRVYVLHARQWRRHAALSRVPSLVLARATHTSSRT